MYNKNQLHLLTNHINVPFTCISYFITTGMKNDTIRGISHLTEHVIVEEIMKAAPKLYKNSLVNAYVDKETTCFYATMLSENVIDIIRIFGNILSFFNSGIPKDEIERQKNIILNVENERILSNTELLNILSLEQKAFKSRLKIPVFLDESFTFIGEKDIKAHLESEYYSSSHYLIITGNIPLADYELLSYFKSMSNSLSNNVINAKCDNIPDYDIPFEKFNDTVRKIVAITIISIRTAKEYFALHILCLFYKVYINKFLENTGFFVKDVSFKLYSEKDVIFFKYNTFYQGTFEILQNVNIDKYIDLFMDIKKHFLFGYLQKSSDFLKFNKEIFKLKRYVNITLNYENMVSLIESVSYENLKNIHNSVLNGYYIFLQDD